MGRHGFGKLNRGEAITTCYSPSRTNLGNGTGAVALVEQIVPGGCVSGNSGLDL